ncbi:uncharacterized protein LOC134682029 [Mytilus trossulus]|uniref:uncharacterized protein LOC134682029 n=1 Tax=Mytilus trossulus TaxID=6551 RepID=UPI003004CE30
MAEVVIHPCHQPVVYVSGITSVTDVKILMVDGQNGQSGAIVRILVVMRTLLGLDPAQILLQKTTEQFVKGTPRKKFHVLQQNVQLMGDGQNGQSGVIVQKLAVMNT